MSHFGFLEHQNLRINLQKGLSLWGRRPQTLDRGFIQSRLLPIVQILNMPLSAEHQMR